MSKSQAQAMVLERSRALPAAERQTYAQAIAFAAKLAPELDFETLGRFTENHPGLACSGDQRCTDHGLRAGPATRPG